MNIDMSEEFARMLKHIEHQLREEHLNIALAETRAKQVQSIRKVIPTPKAPEPLTDIIEFLE